MKPSENCYNTIKQFEGLRLNAYLDAVKVPTIGYGNTFYENGQKVRIGDKITKERADELLKFTVDDFAESVSLRLTAAVNQNQFDALVSFAYNVGTGALAKSTLLKKVNANPCDPSIRTEFMKWDKAGGKVLAGLTKRRKLEADLYFRTDKTTT